MTTTFTNTQDTYQLGELRARFDDLTAERDEADAEQLDAWDAENGDELAQLHTIIDSVDESAFYNQEALIAASYFDDYCRDMVEDCYDLSIMPQFIINNIDWEGVAAALAQDYSTVEVDGVTYYYCSC